MPQYHYQANSKKHCSYCEQGFDVIQKISDESLTHCPECGASIKKIIQAPFIAGMLTRDSKNTLSEKNIEKKGFTQYRKVGKGKYEKTAGKGPNYIDGDKL